MAGCAVSHRNRAILCPEWLCARDWQPLRSGADGSGRRLLVGVTI